MTNKEIARNGRAIMSSNTHSVKEKWRLLESLFEDLDPPLPEPGTVVWWRDCGDMPWALGLVGGTTGYGVINRERACYRWDEIEWKPAHVCGPRQKVVDIPPVEEWGKGDDIRAYVTEMDFHDDLGSSRLINREVGIVVTRPEAVAMEADHEGV